MIVVLASIWTWLQIFLTNETTGRTLMSRG